MDQGKKCQSMSDDKTCLKDQYEKKPLFCTKIYFLSFFLAWCKGCTQLNIWHILFLHTQINIFFIWLGKPQKKVRGRGLNGCATKENNLMPLKKELFCGFPKNYKENWKMISFQEVPRAWSSVCNDDHALNLRFHWSLPLRHG